MGNLAARLSVYLVIRGGVGTVCLSYGLALRILRQPGSDVAFVRIVRTGFTRGSHATGWAASKLILILGVVCGR